MEGGALVVEAVVGQGAAAHPDIAVPDLLFAVIDLDPLSLVLYIGNRAAGAFPGAGTAVEADVAGVQNGIRFQLRIREDQAQTDTGTEFLG